MPIDSRITELLFAVDQVAVNTRSIFVLYMTFHDSQDVKELFTSRFHSLSQHMTRDIVFYFILIFGGAICPHKPCHSSVNTCGHYCIHMCGIHPPSVSNEPKHFVMH